MNSGREGSGLSLSQKTQEKTKVYETYGEVTAYGYDNSLVEILLSDKKLYNKLLIYFAKHKIIYFPFKSVEMFATKLGFTTVYFEYIKKLKGTDKLTFIFTRKSLTIKINDIITYTIIEEEEKEEDEEI
ncbi:MAG: hypothetical protein QW575_06255 [Thermoproteota archaeon]